jgi:hypothetical protein
MGDSGVREAARRLHALVDGCGGEHLPWREVTSGAQVDIMLERRLDEQTVAIGELSRQVAALSELIRSSNAARPDKAGSAHRGRSGTHRTFFLVIGAVTLGLIGWAWTRDDLRFIVDQALRLAGTIVGQ